MTTGPARGKSTDEREQDNAAGSPDRVRAVRNIVALYRELEQVARRTDLSLAQYRAMLFLRGGPRRAGEIAASLAVKKPTVSALMATLRDNGWAVDLVDPTDGRVARIVLTNAGVRKLHEFEALLTGQLDAVLRGADMAPILEAFRSINDVLRATRETRLADMETKTDV